MALQNKNKHQPRESEAAVDTIPHCWVTTYCYFTASKAFGTSELFRLLHSTRTHSVKRWPRYWRIQKYFKNHCHSFFFFFFFKTRAHSMWERGWSTTWIQGGGGGIKKNFFLVFFWHIVKLANKQVSKKKKRPQTHICTHRGKKSVFKLFPAIINYKHFIKLFYVLTKMQWNIN